MKVTGSGARLRFDDNVEVGARRLGLEGLARELAASRREVAALTHENERLRARLQVLDPQSAQPEPSQHRDPFPTLTGLSCPGCGFAIDADALERDRALLAAACCPRCDGRLTVRMTSTREPSVFLG